MIPTEKDLTELKAGQTVTIFNQKLGSRRLTKEGEAALVRPDKGRSEDGMPPCWYVRFPEDPDMECSRLIMSGERVREHNAGD